jgi:putative DNA primase/helicase
MAHDVDFDAIARAALNAADSLLHHWLPGGRCIGSEYVVRNPKRADHRPGSFKINTQTGVWADFATNERGGNLISLRAWLDNTSQIDAARAIAAELGIATVNGHKHNVASWRAIVPVPNDAPQPPTRHYKLGEPSHIAEYRDATGRLLCVIHRYEPPGKRKQILPLTYCTDGTRADWRWQSLPKPRPLYGVDLLAARPDAPVLIVEGEPKCDAARRLIGDRVIVIAWPGGAQAVKHVDWSPLAGRTVAIWPDADEPGLAAADWIAGHLIKLGALKVGIVTPPDGVAEGWDLADAEREGWTGDRVLAHVRDHTVRRDAPQEHPPADDPLPDVPPPSPDDAHQPLQPADAPFRALGYDRGRYFFLPASAQQVVELGPRDLDRMGCLLQLAPLSWWQTFYPSRDGVATRAVANDLIQSCHRAGVFDPARVRGRGAWLDQDRVVLHLGDRLLVDDTEYDVAAFSSAHIYERARPLALRLGEPLTNREAARLIDVCCHVSWEHPDAMGRLLAGWLVIAPVCGALAWRPHIWITSEHGAGKTWVLDNIVKPTLGAIALHVQSKTTEAGLRGELGLDARPIVFDEAETQNTRDRDRLQQILDLARQASSETGAAILKGTQTGGVKRYSIRSCFAFSSINVGLAQAADESRTIVLSISPPSDQDARNQSFAELKALVTDVITQDFSARLLARTLKLLPTLRANAETFAAAIARHYGSRRLGDTLGAVLAGAWSLRSSRLVSVDEADEIVAEREWVRTTAERHTTEPDWSRALAHLAQIEIRVASINSGRLEPVSFGEIVSVLTGSSTDANLTRDEMRKAFLRAGAKVETINGREYVAVAKQSEAIRRGFAGTPWESAWCDALLRVPGAARHPVGAPRFGAFTSRAIVLPAEKFC